MAIARIDVRTLDVFGRVAGRWIAAHGEVEKLSVQIARDGATIAARRIAIAVPPGIALQRRGSSSPRLGARSDPRRRGAILPVLVDRAEVHLASAGAHATITAPPTNIRTRRISRSVGRAGAACSVHWKPRDRTRRPSANLDVRGTTELAEVRGVVAAGDERRRIDGRVGSARSVSPRARPGRASNLGESRVRVRGVELAMFGGPALSLSADLLARATNTERGIEAHHRRRRRRFVRWRAVVLALDASA